METLIMAKDGKGKGQTSVPSEFFNAEGTYDPTLVPKDVRCRIVGCPEIIWKDGDIEIGSFVVVSGLDDLPHEVIDLLDGFAEIKVAGFGTDDSVITVQLSGLRRVRNPKCAVCTGPVKWKNHTGRFTGDKRSCTNCPMNGLRLAVCYHGCPGPNMGFASDGMSMVTLGSLADPSAFIYDNLPQNREPDKIAEPDCDTESEKRADGWSDESETETEPSTRHGQRELSIAKKLLELDGQAFDNFRTEYRNHLGDPKAIAKALGTSPDLFRGAMSEGRRIMRVVRFITGDEWEVIRSIIMGRSQTETAGLTNVKKQAVNARLKTIIRENPWVGKINVYRNLKS